MLNVSLALPQKNLNPVKRPSAEDCLGVSVWNGPNAVNHVGSLFHVEKLELMRASR